MSVGTSDKRRAVARHLAPLIACGTLGLAPFFPEPHIVGKLRWLLGGAHGMAAMDWFDLAYHGAPWIWLLVVLAVDVRLLSRKSGSAVDLRRRTWLWVGLALGAAALCVALASR